MIDSDKMEFARLLMAAGEMYSREISKELKRMYFDALRDLSIEQVSEALNAHINNPDGGQYFPKPADLRRYLQGTAKQQATAIEDKAAIAWSAICEQIRKVGSYGTLRLDDKQALATVKAMGGWSMLCQSTTDELVWKRKEFVRMYETFERTPLEALPASLPGRIELSGHKAQGAQRLDHLMLGIARRLGVSDDKE